jgi:hypothetical protein
MSGQGFLSTTPTLMGTSDGACATKHEPQTVADPARVIGAARISDGALSSLYVGARLSITMDG